MSNSRTNTPRFQIGPVLLLLTAAFAVYGRVIGHDFLFNWDDNWYVTWNESASGFSWDHVRTAFTSYYLGNYAPVQIISYMLDYDLWGLNAGGFLVTNILIHAANAILVYVLLLRWYDDRLLAIFAAALFLLHPVQVESVAWISQRKNLLSMFFFLVAWEGYSRYREAPAGKGRLVYAASVAAFVLSLLAKSMTVILPVVLVFFDLCFFKESRRLRLKDKVPYILAAGVVAALAIYSEKPEFGGGRTGFHGGSPLATFFTMLPVFCRYLGMLVWPVGLSAEYAPPIHQSIDATVIGATLLLAGVAIAEVRLYRNDRRLGFWVLFFWVGLLPVSQIVPMLSMINDRYLYMPIMGVAALAGSGAVLLRERFGTNRSAMLYLLLALPLMALSVVSFQRASAWRNSLTLWNDAVVKTPNSSRAWGLLAETYHFAGDNDAARRAYERGLELNPEQVQVLSGLGDLYNDLGELDKGYELLNRLIKIDPEDAIGWARLGDNYLKRGDYTQAESAYKRALAIQPDAMQVVMMLGDLAVIQGRLEKARDYYSQVEAKGWNDPDTAYHLACVEALSGRKDEALAWLETALQRGYANYNALNSGKELTALWEDPRFKYLLLQYFPGKTGGHFP